MARSEYQADQLLGHADNNDGIQEYDNRLPRWWLWLFYITVAGGVWMFLDWHVLNDKSLAGLYAEEVNEAEARYAGLGLTAPTDIPVRDEMAVAEGQALFYENCVHCHGVDATGLVGPNLTDPVWIWGGSPQEIAHTIYVGVEQQSMPRWGPILGSEGVAKVAAYVHGLGGGM